MKTHRYIIPICIVAAMYSVTCNAQSAEAADQRRDFAVNIAQNGVKTVTEEDETGFIYDDDIAGEIKTYLMDMAVGNNTGYGVVFSHDDKMAAYISWDDDGKTAYVKNLSTLNDVWVKGQVTDDKLWISTGQPIFRQENTGKLYQLIIALYDVNNNSMESQMGINFTFNEDRTRLTMDESEEEGKRLVLFTMCYEDGNVLQAFSSVNLEEFTDKPVEVPSTAGYERYEYSAFLSGDIEWRDRCWIAFDGDTAYVQGLEWCWPEGWVKGNVLSDGSIRIPSGQFMGMNGNYPDYYWGAEITGGNSEYGFELEEKSFFVLEYDRDAGSYRMAEDECFKSGKDFSWGYPITNSLYTPLPVTPATPQAPYDLSYDSSTREFSFRIPAVDADGNELDSTLLTYSVFINDELYIFTPDKYPVYYDMSEIGFEDSFGYDYDSRRWMITIEDGMKMTSIGVESYYNIPGDKRTSERTAIEVKSVQDTEYCQNAVPVEYYSIDGRKLTSPAQGINIVKMSDGSVRKILHGID